MKVLLSNPHHRVNGVASIPRPIPKAEYDRCIAILNALDIPAVDGGEVHVHLWNSGHDWYIEAEQEPACAMGGECGDMGLIPRETPVQ